MADTGELETDMLFKGLTRPATLLGVSVMLLGMIFLTCAMGFVLTSDFRMFLAGFVLYGITYVLYQKEPLFMELFMIKQQKCNKCKNRLYHGLTNSYDVM